MSLTSLRGRNNFRRVLGRGQARRSDGLVLHWAPNGLEENRYATAAKTSTGCAVVRNRIRRWGRVLLRQWDSEIHAGHDLVVIAHGREAAASFQNFEFHLDRVLQKAELKENVY